MEENKTPTSDIFDSLKCVVCFDISKDAVECLSCGNVFCKMCVFNIKCPLCRTHSAYKDSYFARKIIDCMPIKCHECGDSTTNGKLEDHLDQCPGRIFNCKKNCGFEAKRDDFAKHVLECHMKEVINEFDKKYMKKTTNVYNLFNQKVNAMGKTAIRGTTGKFYCGEKSDVNCGTCDGNCGPTNGCQCTDCMKLDKEFYGLPAGYTLNHEGLICQLVEMKFYCGVREMNRVCSPEAGACNACERITNCGLVKTMIKLQMVMKC